MREVYKIWLGMCLFSHHHNHERTSEENVHQLHARIAQLESQLQLKHGTTPGLSEEDDVLVSQNREVDPSEPSPTTTQVFSLGEVAEQPPTPVHFSNTPPIRVDMAYIDPTGAYTPVHLTQRSKTNGANAPATANYKFNLSLAQVRLRAQGVTPPAESVLGSVDAAVPPSPIIQPSHNARDCDSIWLVDRDEALRLCGVYEEEIGIAYPLLNIETVYSQIGRLYDALEAARRHGFAFASLNDSTILSSESLKIIKLVFACALTIETSGASKLGIALFEEVKTSVHDLLWATVDINSIKIYILLATWQFLSDNDYLAWRLTGLVARWCLEIGLNQSLFLQQLSDDEDERKMAVRLFWCVHTLDRRWSFGNGLPFVIQDHDIDRCLPEPDDDVPYLKAMVRFSRIASDVWYALYGNQMGRSTSGSDTDVPYLDYQISQWWQDLPAKLKSGKDDPAWPRGIRRLRILLYLRKCQLTISLHQSVLQCETKMQQDLQTARSVVEIAKDMIRRLVELNASSNIYQTQQMCFNYFLVLALGVVFLAAAQNPAQFAQSVRCEFHSALGLVQRLSADSVISARLWKNIYVLRHLGDRLGVPLTDGAAEFDQFLESDFDFSRHTGPQFGTDVKTGFFPFDHDF